MAAHRRLPNSCCESSLPEKFLTDFRLAKASMTGIPADLSALGRAFSSAISDMPEKRTAAIMISFFIIFIILKCIYPHHVKKDIQRLQKASARES